VSNQVKVVAKNARRTGCALASSSIGGKVNAKLGISNTQKTSSLIPRGLSGGALS